MEKIIIISIVAGAAWWLLRRYVRQLKGDGGSEGCCNGCKGCGIQENCNDSSENQNKGEH